jgi:hypothetical protein
MSLEGCKGKLEEPGSQKPALEQTINPAPEKDASSK